MKKEDRVVFIGLDKPLVDADYKYINDGADIPVKGKIYTVSDFNPRSESIQLVELSCGACVGYRAHLFRKVQPCQIKNLVKEAIKNPEWIKTVPEKIEEMEKFFTTEAEF